jgi:anti-sigma factor RsiW
VNGYNVVSWHQDGMQFRAVSDFKMDLLANFAKRLRKP